MTEVASYRFHAMTEELAARIEGTLHDFAREHGRVYNAMDMHQSHLSVKDLAEQAVMFGMNVWAHSPEDHQGNLPGNVVPLTRRKPAGGPRMLRTALQTITAVIATTVVAAATTEAVSLPGLHYVTHFIYAKHAPPLVERTVEDHGQLRRVVFQRIPGEPFEVVHVISSRPVDDPMIATAPDHEQEG
jgi:hypothetical protein